MANASSHASGNDSSLSDDSLDSEVSYLFEDWPEESSRPVLFRYLLKGEWSEASVRIRSHPHEAGLTCGRMLLPRGQRALHVAVRDASGFPPPPVDLVRALIGVGNTVTAQDATGTTALHIAVASRTSDGSMNDLIRALLGAGGAEATAETSPNRKHLMKIQTRDGVTPLGVFCATWIDAVSSGCCKVALKRAMTGWASSPADLRGRLRVLWDRADLLLCAAKGEGLPNSLSGRNNMGDRGGEGDYAASPYNYQGMLSRVVSSPEPLPASLVQLAIRLCGADQGFERDGRGRVPLAAAAAMPLGALRRRRHDDAQLAISALCEACPSSASMADRDGRLALHLALGPGGRTWDTGVEAVLADAPRALATRDVTTHLYPFMLAATGDGSDLTTVYLLLRENPNLAWGLAADSPWVKTMKLREEVKRLKDENAEHVKENKRLKVEVQKLKLKLAGFEAQNNDGIDSELRKSKNEKESSAGVEQEDPKPARLAKHRKR